MASYFCNKYFFLKNHKSATLKLRNFEPMKTIRLFSLLIILLFSRISYSQETWIPFSCNVSFKIKNAGLTVNGTFDTVSAMLVFAPDHLSASSLSGKVIVNSINTGINKMEKHLKKQEFFDADQFKDIEIKSTKIYYKDARYAGLFDVTIKGVTKQIEIPFDFIPLTNEAEFKGDFTINRRDFGVGGKSMMMSDNVAVAIDIKARK